MKKMELINSLLFAQVIFLAVFWSMLMKYFWGKDGSAPSPEKMAHAAMDLFFKCGYVNLIAALSIMLFHIELIIE